MIDLKDKLSLLVAKTTFEPTPHEFDVYQPPTKKFNRIN